MDDDSRTKVGEVRASGLFIPGRYSLGPCAFIAKNGGGGGSDGQSQTYFFDFNRNQEHIVLLMVLL